jgi:S-adenosylmethionine hydrolase
MLEPALVTLTTDFGEGSSYAAALKGAVLSVNPAARILDLTHRIPPQDLAATSYFLVEALPYFPDGTIHVIVVDPGVGSERALLCVEWRGQHLLVPDNGCWTGLEAMAADQPLIVRQLAEPKYWLSPVSPTFHGRDILAPVAGHLSLGVRPELLGVVTNEWERLVLPQPVATASEIQGAVIRIDTFGNLITNISASAVHSFRDIRLAGRTIGRWVRTYSDAEPGSAVALIGSSGLLEIAVVNGSAAIAFGIGIGARVCVSNLGVA